MRLLGNIVRGSATPATEEFDQVSSEGADYEAALGALRAAVPEGWMLASITITDH